MIIVYPNQASVSCNSKQSNNHIAESKIKTSRSNDPSHNQEYHEKIFEHNCVHYAQQYIGYFRYAGGPHSLNSPTIVNPVSSVSPLKRLYIQGKRFEEKPLKSSPIASYEDRSQPRVLIDTLTTRYLPAANEGTNFEDSTKRREKPSKIASAIETVQNFDLCSL
uniref:Uncharacterized protein n=1 Tax=Glossina pallidipes TaxID=7398 RepID=A0A1B0A4E3_GLOPL